MTMEYNNNNIIYISLGIVPIQKKKTQKMDTN